jgi:hypothetical protein
MALSISKRFKFKKIWWKSGHFYTFRYSNYYEDPKPVVVLLYKFSGTHPNTGRQWRFIQCINLNYIQRNVRKNFVLNWKEELIRRNGNVFLTWETIKRRFPNVANSNAIRRYFYSPSYYIQDPEYIELDNVEDAVISSWHKDFSKKLKKAAIRKIKDAKALAKKRSGVSKILGALFGGRRR